MRDGLQSREKKNSTAKKGTRADTKGDESTANADQEEWPGRGVEGVLQRDEFRVIFGHPARVCSPHLRVHAIPMMKHGHSRTCADAAVHTRWEHNNKKKGRMHERILPPANLQGIVPVKRGHHGMSALIGVRDSRAAALSPHMSSSSHAPRYRVCAHPCRCVLYAYCDASTCCANTQAPG